jgi:hypothetical protein
MIVEEISDRFDYAIKKSVGGVALDEYNKSLYLTKSQLRFVRNIVKVYEYTDEMRHILAPLIQTRVINSGDFTQGVDYWFTNAGIIVDNTTLEVVYEHLNDKIPLIPLDHNDIHYTINNPFRSPDNKIAYRVTVNDEWRIYTDQVLSQYTYTWVKYPDPIVLENLTGTGLEVSGVTLPTTSELADDVVIQIIEQAVDLAINDIRKIAAPPAEEN